MAEFRKVIIRHTGKNERERRRALLHELAAVRAVGVRSRTATAPPERRPRWTVVLVALAFALATLVTSELVLPGLFELALAAVLLGFGLAAAGPLRSRESSRVAGGSRAPTLDSQEQVRRQVRLLERRRLRCLQTLAEVHACEARERHAGRATGRLETAAEALTAAVAGFDAGIVRELAIGLALRAARWMERLPSLVEGSERLDLGACRFRLERLETAGREADDLAVELGAPPYAAEPAARDARALLDAGRDEIARLRVDLLARQTALLTRVELPGIAPSSVRREFEAALGRGWDWLCRNQARRELNRWEAETVAAPVTLAEPVRIVLPRGRDMSMLPFSLVLLGFTTAHASLAVGDVAWNAPFLLLPMAAFYALFLVPGFLLFREAVRARRHEELTVCGSVVVLRWRWLLWSGVETLVVAPEEPVRREEVGGGEAHPIGRLCLQGMDGRRLAFAFGLTEAQHAHVLRQMGRQLAPLPPPRGEPCPPARPESDPLSEPGGDGSWGLPLV